VRLRWVFIPLAAFAVAAIVPTVIGSTSGPGRGGAEGVPGWAFAAYAVAGLALLAFIALLCAWIALGRGRG
jgi:hypothetical protein